MNSLHAVNKPVWDVSTAIHLTEPGLDLGMLQVLSGALGCRGTILKKPFLKRKIKGDLHGLVSLCFETKLPCKGLILCYSLVLNH